MARRTIAQALEPSHLTNAAQIFRESIRILLLHTTYFHSISIFLFSPLPISLFLSHLLLLHHPTRIPSSSMLKLTGHLLGEKVDHLPLLLKQLSKTIFHIAICLPSTVTFSLLGRAATIQAVSDSYGGINLNTRRLFMRSGLAWIKLLHTSFWEFMIAFSLFGLLVTSLDTIPEMLLAWGICSRALGFWGVLGFVGVPFCVAFANVMVVGNLAMVLSVLEGDKCFGFGSLVRARRLIKGRGQTALAMALLSNVGFRLVECLFEFRMQKGMSLWEVPMLVSMYSFVLVLESVMNVVFYYTCKPSDSIV